MGHKFWLGNKQYLVFSYKEKNFKLSINLKYMDCMPAYVQGAVWANQSIKINEVKSSREVQIFFK